MFHINKEKNTITKGHIKNKTTLIKLKFNSIFLNNLNKSLKGWKYPLKRFLFGPNRKWIYPKILRSNKVKNATLKRIKIIIIKEGIKNIYEKLITLFKS